MQCVPLQVVARFAGHTVRGVLMAWRGAVHAKGQRRDLLAVAAGRLRNRQLAAAFSSWRDHAAHSQVLTGSVLSLLAPGASCLRDCGTDKHTASHCRTLCVLLLHTVCWRGCPQAIQELSAEHGCLQDLHQRLRGAVGRMMNKQLGAAFSRWREHLQEAQVRAAEHHAA